MRSSRRVQLECLNKRKWLFTLPPFERTLIRAEEEGGVEEITQERALEERDAHSVGFPEAIWYDVPYENDHY